ncbi:elongation factor P maturation arginine rhamnosyltransferase EarP [Massilia sp. BJB1822]|uniref:elongation factor P maturation arginine rhamnosyltransferase EarP n=1 Tax=Massilia sp. BJB1822 TaxID=2744470 RepID=UPI001593CAB6|nr:elongation factor P maturation arginine rhamnosyltransferase EarP [Massilia sp. BJB1822]NVD97205.1 elongation factor P maturation arginine rhamnosyltransferase EarP [Massilia sp. BJB1822]
MTQATSLALFCKVVDNYGDIGICWRFARQLAQEHGIAVTLWVDDLHTFQRICPEVQTGAALQQIGAIAVRHWATQEGEFAPADIADIVIEFFGCEIPPGYIAAMAECEPRPVWLNLEGLSAEEWVEGCHTLPSMHPRFSLTKHFFFPGFTEKTGGLLREAALEEERQQFQSDPAAMAAFLAQFGLTPQEIAARKVTLFCYPHAPVAQLFEAWEEGDEEIACLVPQGVAAQAVHAFLGEAANPGVMRRRGALSVRVLPFVPQQDYDKLLWASDLNFVRGEDSVVRAQWAGKPFIWHIYPQDENLHHKKLRAFLQRYAAGSASLDAFFLYWNGARPQGGAESPDWSALWTDLRADMAGLTQHAIEWQRHLYTLGDLTTNLLKFSSSLR